MNYTVRQLAGLAGVSVRTLHYYDRIGLLKPTGRAANGYRMYSDESLIPLQQILFFRELAFSLKDIKAIVSRPDFDVVEALRSHRALLSRQAARLAVLLSTVEKTIAKLEGDADMGIREYYEGFSDETIEAYRQEVRRRWGDDTLRDSEARVTRMGRAAFAALQAEGGAIFKAVADYMADGYASAPVQEQVAMWRKWLNNFSTYSDEAALGLGRMYSLDHRFAAYLERFGQGLPAFLTKAIEHYFARQAAVD